MSDDKKSATPSSFTVKCAYCDGEGVVHEYEFGDQPCPVSGCKEGRLNLKGSEKDYKPCGFCSGRGKIEHRIYGAEQCKTCHGTGLEKVR